LSYFSLSIARPRPPSSTLSLHDALPIWIVKIDSIEGGREAVGVALAPYLPVRDDVETGVLLCLDGHDGRDIITDGEIRRESYSKDRKSTRLNSSHVKISYAVFCLKKKNR